MSNRCKKRSLNLASYHASVSSNLTPYYTGSKKETSRFDNIIKATKAGRKKRAKRKNSRAYLYDCSCEYSPIVKTEKTREVKANIRFPFPANISAMEIEEKYTFRFDSMGKEYTKEQALILVRKKFFRWCNARGFAQGDKVSINTISGEFHFVAEKSPDMRILPTRSVSSL